VGTTITGQGEIASICWATLPTSADRSAPAIEHRRREGSGVHEDKPSAKITCEVVCDVRGAPGAIRVVNPAHHAADHQQPHSI
jgi:hypothetical protein